MQIGLSRIWYAITIINGHQQIISSNQTVNLLSISNKVVGTGFVFNDQTGVFTLTGTESNRLYNSDLHGYFTCDSDKIDCTTMFKITATTSITGWTTIYTPSKGTSYFGAAIPVIMSSRFDIDQANGTLYFPGEYFTSLSEYALGSQSNFCASGTAEKIYNNCTRASIPSLSLNGFSYDGYYSITQGIAYYITRADIYTS